MSIGAFIVFCIAMVLWATIVAYFLPLGVEHLEQGLKRQPDEGLRPAFERSHKDLSGLWQKKERDAFWDSFGELFEAAAWLLAGLIIFIVGLSLLASVLPAWKVWATVFGFGFLGTGRWALRRYRQNWRRYAQERGHGQDVLLHLAGIVILPIAGTLLLFLVFR